jgi:hypothetical protein
LNTGEQIAGQLVNLGPDDLRLLVDGQERRLPLDGVAQIDRIGDSLKNGAIIGGLIAGVWCAVVCGQGLDSKVQLPAVVAANAGIGALIGVGIDAANQKRTTIYQRRTAPGGSTLRAVIVFRLSF